MSDPVTRRRASNRLVRDVEAGRLLGPGRGVGLAVKRAGGYRVTDHEKVNGGHENEHGAQCTLLSALPDHAIGGGDALAKTRIQAPEI